MEMIMSDPNLIVLQTLSDLLDHGHGMSGWCYDCAETYDPTMLPLISRPAGFDIDLVALIAERGSSSTAIHAEPVPCPCCGSSRTTIRITAPSRGR
jgi:hypothetical protein